MGTRTTFKSKVRSQGGRDASTPGSGVFTALCSFDPTAASAPVKLGTSATVGDDFILPKGAMVLYIKSYGGATGGASPTVDLGSSAESAGFANEMDADAANNTLQVATGNLVTTSGLSADTVVYGGVGASAATGGTFTCQFVWTVVDDHKFQD